MKLDMGKDYFSIKLHVLEIKARMSHNLIIHFILIYFDEKKMKVFFVKFSSIEFRYNISRSLNRVFHVARLIKV